MEEYAGMIGSRETPLYRRINLPMLVAGAIAGILTLGMDPWWTLQGASSNQIILIKVSPFFLEMHATGLPVDLPGVTLIGAVTRMLVGLASLFLILSSVWKGAWWRNLAQWFNIAAIVEVFLSLAIMIGTVRQEILAKYGMAFPLSGRFQFPANVLGMDLQLYPSPVLIAGFELPFYIGVVCLAIVAAERLTSLRSIEVLSRIRNIREVHVLPPYKRVWMASDDKGLNPLSTDPEKVSDEQLIVSFGNMFRAVEPGGIVRILLPSWAGWVGDRIQSLVRTVGFRLETLAMVREQGQEEIELRLKKPIVEESYGPRIGQSTSLPVETAEAEASRVPEEMEREQQENAPKIGGLTVVSSDQTPIVPVPVPAPTISKRTGRPVWPSSSQVSRTEIAMVKSAVKTISTQGSPVDYRQLLNTVYRDLLGHGSGDEFASVREIEAGLLRHVGLELVVLEEANPQNGTLIKKWWIGEEEPEETDSSHPSYLDRLEKIKSINKAASARLQGFMSRLRHERKSSYRPRRGNDDE